ncbi:undecaprenyl-diphosphate phosphatase [Candidatus Parcubacteria bacterium]|nr:undecaprenyl-diphosphate phosphatase [Candidatus Parcubacteria bacterium]
MFNFIISGILQGIFEWLPVSSEGIVALFNKYFSAGFNPLDLALFLHLGTLLAVLVYFRKDFWRILLLKDKKLFRFLLIATTISLIIAFPLYKIASSVALGGWLLFLTGFGLLATAFLHKTKKQNLSLQGNKLAFLVGFLQGLSVIPGVSRSGATIFGLSFGEREPREVLRLSYLMSAPVVAASSLFLLLKGDFTFNFDVGLALFFAFIVGFLSLKILLKVVEKVNFFKFALIFGLLCLVAGFVEFLI